MILIRYKSIIGFGSYYYKYESGHEGVAPFVGFSPRKAKISLYFAQGDTKHEILLKDFGKYTSGKACVLERGWHRRFCLERCILMIEMTLIYCYDR
ncbi:hypothetical protein D3C76_942110 [compost metagenome]